MKKVFNDLFDYSGYKIFQVEEGFKFSIDSILLAECVQVHKKDQMILDLCTGNAVVPLILTTKTKIPIVGFEIQTEIANLAIESVLYNKKSNQISIINDSVVNVDKYFPGNKFDIITCNPPYFKYHHANFINQSTFKSLARHEVTVCLAEVISIASTMIKDKGNFYLVHIAERFQEILYELYIKQFFVKDVYFVYPKRNCDAKLVLVRAIKNGNIGLKVHEALYLNELSTYQNLFLRGEL